MIEIVEAATANTVQDAGRLGYGHIGVGRSGAMDPVSLQVGNILLGNGVEAAAIEVQVFPFRVRFLTSGAFAVTGADCEPTLSGLALPPWWTTIARAGQVLTLRPPQDGARSYLALAGGIDVPVVLGSRSTHLRGGFGGLQGRPLQNGDQLRTGSSTQVPRSMGAAPPHRPKDRVLTVRAIAASEHDEFPDAMQQVFWSTEWRITANSNRHGYRLGGPTLLGGDAFNIRSTPILPGIVQVPPGGAPIVQMSDANSAGGYPKMATVITADLPLLGQAPLGSRIRFARTDYATAVAAEAETETYLAKVHRMVTLYRQAAA